MVKEEDEHLSGYQARDFEVVDYQLYRLPEIGLSMRGPRPSFEAGTYITCVGAAQTFGCFCEQPYPMLLERELGVNIVNLGYGGAGPRFFNRHPGLIDIINRGRLAVVQVMSGRSEDNSRFESRGLEWMTRRRDGKKMSADAAWRSVLECRYLWRRSPVARRLARRVCKHFGEMDAKRLLIETRANWLASYSELFSRIKVPTISLWFSARPPEYTESFGSLHKFFGKYPQLVNRTMLDQIARLADDNVECVTSRGLPQNLVSRFDGTPVEVDLGNDREDFAGMTWKQNRYYPSPEMHVDAAAALLPCVRRLIQR